MKFGKNKKTAEEAVNAKTANAESLNTNITNTETTNKAKKPKKKSSKLKIALVLSIFIFFTGCIYMVIAFHYKTHFLPGTTINGMNCEGLSVEDVKEKLQQSISDYKLSISQPASVS